MNIAEEYKKSLKMAEAEEILDLVIYRPIAFVIVKLIYRLPITPNQVTYGALIAGLISAIQFSRGTPNGFAWGAMWFAIANVLDCGDGMLARLQKSGTPLGRIVDGIVDWASSVAIFFGLGVGMSAYFEQPLYWILAIAAGATSGYQAMVFDKRQQEYISTVRGEKNFMERESERVDSELQKSSNPMRKFFLSAYKSYMMVQEGPQQTEEEIKRYPPEVYQRYNKGIMRWWTWLGPTTNRTLLMSAGLLAHPEWFCWLVVIPINLYLLFMFWWQKQITRRLDEASNSSTLRTVSIVA
ncbi:MAG: CDP-alcohol phosphatidyltransferase family protein [Bacteroidota bacterium]